MVNSGCGKGGIIKINQLKLSTWEAEGGRSKFKANLVDIVIQGEKKKDKRVFILKHSDATQVIHVKRNF